MPTDRISGFNMGVSFKVACQVAAASPITLSGAQTIDGKSVGTNSERVLVLGQSDASENGIYISDSSSWIRAKDCDGNKDLLPGSLVYVDQGNTYARTFWVFESSSTATSIQIGVDDITLSNITQNLAGVSAWVTSNWLGITSSAQALTVVGGLSSTANLGSTWVQTNIMGSSTWSQISHMHDAKWFGCVGDGVTNDTSNMQAAITSAKGAKLFIPEGRYRMTSALTSSGSLAIEGAGKGLTELRWSTAAGSAGIKIYQSSGSSAAVRVAHLSLVNASSASADTALMISATAQTVVLSTSNYTQGDQDRVTVEGIQIAGAGAIDIQSYTTSGWGTGVNLVSAVNTCIRDCSFIGRALSPFAGSTGGVGVFLNGSPDNIYENGHPNTVIISNCNTWFWDVGYYVNNYEGVYLTNNNTVACNYGIQIQGSSANQHPQANVVSNHFNCRDAGIVWFSQVDVNVSKNLIYQTATSTQYVGVQAFTSDIVSYIIEGNIFVPGSTVAGSMNCIVTYGNSGLISNNIFRQGNNTIATGVFCTTQSYANWGSNNLFIGTPQNVAYLNFGATTNPVAGSVSNPSTTFIRLNSSL